MSFASWKCGPKRKGVRVCKEGIKIGRATSVNLTKVTGISAFPKALVGARAERLSLSLVARFDNWSNLMGGTAAVAAHAIDGTIDANNPLETVALTVAAHTIDYTGVVGVGTQRSFVVGTWDGSTFKGIVALSPETPSALLSIERYGQLIFQPLFVYSPQAYSGDVDVGDVYLTQTLDSI